MSYTDLPAPVVQLQAVVQHLSERDRSFADSLITQSVVRGSLSDKQLYWVRELTKRATDKAIASQPAQAAPAPKFPPPVATKSFARIVELFAKAGSRGLVVFRTASDYEFRLSVAGERSQQPGSINVTDNNTGGFENRTWFGRITTSGAWQPSRKVGGTEAVEAALALFNADPAKAAAEYGHSVGACCFCRRELTDERSVSVGYGPICADRFGLPWGEVPGKPAPENKLTCDVPF
jgi:hypothetical protein